MGLRSTHGKADLPTEVKSVNFELKFMALAMSYLAIPAAAIVLFRYTSFSHRRRRSEMTSAGKCLYARILYSKIKYK